MVQEIMHIPVLFAIRHVVKQSTFSVRASASGHLPLHSLVQTISLFAVFSGKIISKRLIIIRHNSGKLSCHKGSRRRIMPPLGFLKIGNLYRFNHIDGFIPRVIKDITVPA